MSCVPSIAAALRACMPCPAAPPTRHLVLCDRVAESRAQPGMTIQVRLNSIDARDSLGRIAHVRGFYIDATGVFDIAGPTNDAVTAYQLRSLYTAMFLEDITGHAFWPSIDGRDVLDDSWFRHWAQIQWPYMHSGSQDDVVANTNAQSGNQPFQFFDYGLAANLAAATYRRNMSLYCPLVTLGPGMNPLAGLLPLASLQRQSGEGSLRFRLGSVIAGTPAGVDFTGVENGEGNAGLDVWADVVYLPALAVGPSYTMESYTLPDSSGILRRPEDTTEHVQIRFYPEEQAGANFPGQSAVTSLTPITLTVAGFNELPGLSNVDFIKRGLLFAASERDSALTRANQEQDLPLLDPTPPGGPVGLAGILLPYRQRGMGPAQGQITFKYGSLGGLTNVRYLHRTVACNEEARADDIAKAVGCDPCSPSVMTDAKGNPTNQQVMKTGTLLILDPNARG